MFSNFSEPFVALSSTGLRDAMKLSCGLAAHVVPTFPAAMKDKKVMQFEGGLLVEPEYFSKSPTNADTRK
jgi:hypothetical protein